MVRRSRPKIYVTTWLGSRRNRATKFAATKQPPDIVASGIPQKQGTKKRSPLRSTLATLALAAVVVLAPACSLAIPTAPGTTQPGASDDQKRLDALNRYIELERATLPRVEAEFPGMYKDITFDGAIKNLGAAEGVAPGRYAEITFHYVFAAENDWDASIPLFETQRAELDKVCKRDLFPAMSVRGVSGIKAAVWSYTDIGNESKVMWSQSCYSE